MIAGIFLAAGRSRRFGTHKLLLEVAGKPLVYYSLKNCVDSMLPEVTVVLGAQREELEEAIGQYFMDRPKIKIIVNEEHERGMMSSLKMGIQSINPDCQGAMVLLADMLLVTPGIIDHLMGVFEEENKIIIPECLGELYHPRIIPARLFHDFLRLEDSEKGTRVLDEHREEIVHVTIGSRTNYVDIDRLDDFEAIAELLKNRSC